MTKEERMEKARALHKQGCNCCQSVVMAYADKLPIKPEDAMNVAAPFGRGLAGTREVCGCVSGMAMVCGLTGHNADVRPLIVRTPTGRRQEALRRDGGRRCRHFI